MRYLHGWRIIAEALIEPPARNSGLPRLTTPPLFLNDPVKQPLTSRAAAANGFSLAWD
jgi:hypothetical protein